MTRRRRRFTPALVVALLMSVLQSGTMPARACAETIVIYDYKLKIEGGAESYRIGQTAKIKVTVTRPDEEDPAGLGIPLGQPPYSEPVNEANVGVGLQVGQVFLPGYAKTGSDGVANVKIKLEKWLTPGSGDVRALAWKVVLDGGCVIIEEQGFAAAPGLFEVTR